jgi:hypothetical protein
VGVSLRQAALASWDSTATTEGSGRLEVEYANTYAFDIRLTRAMQLVGAR